MDIINPMPFLLCLVLVVNMHVLSAFIAPGMRAEVEVPDEETQLDQLPEGSPEPPVESSTPPPSNQAFLPASRTRDERKRVTSSEDNDGEDELTSVSRKGQSKRGKRKRSKETSSECGERSTHMGRGVDQNGRKQHHDGKSQRKPGKKEGAQEPAGVPYPGGGGKEAFNILTMGAVQMMSQWMTEAKRRYPEEFERLVTEWSYIMTEFDNISFPDPTENNTMLGSPGEAPDMAKDFVNYDSDSGSLPNYFQNARYSVVSASPSGYEVRKYESTLWINVIVNTSSYDFAGMIAFKRLFEYAQGKNSLGIQVPMTIPLRKQIKSVNGRIAPVSLLRDEGFRVSIYLPDEYIHNLPEPLDDDLFLEYSDLFAYAFNFSGWAYGLNVYQKYFECHNVLAENNEPVEEGKFYMQMYDSPWVINAAERHNELLIPVSCSHGGFHSCNGQQAEQRQIEALVKIRTISTRREVSLQLLQRGVFVTQSSDLNLNMTERIYGSYPGCFSRIHPLIQTSYMTHSAPYFLKLMPRESSSTTDCNPCFKSLYYIPEVIYDSYVQPNILREAPPVVDSVNPTLYFVMKFPKLPKLSREDILDSYDRMQSILQSRGYCFSQDEVLVGYRRDQQWLNDLEMFIPADLHCSDSQY